MRKTALDTFEEDEVCDTVKNLREICDALRAEGKKVGGWVGSGRISPDSPYPLCTRCASLLVPTHRTMTTTTLRLRLLEHCLPSVPPSLCASFWLRRASTLLSESYPPPPLNPLFPAMRRHHSLPAGDRLQRDDLRRGHQPPRGHRQAPQPAAGALHQGDGSRAGGTSGSKICRDPPSSPRRPPGGARQDEQPACVEGRRPRV